MIFVECKPDQALVRSLGNRVVRHHEGKDKLLNKLMKEKRIKGMVDQDPGASQHPYLRKLKVAEPEHDIIFRHDPETGNAIIILCPALEGWLLKTLQETGEKIVGLSNNEKLLRNQLTVHPEIIEKIVKKILPQSERLKTLKKMLEKIPK